MPCAEDGRAWRGGGVFSCIKIDSMHTWPWSRWQDRQHLYMGGGGMYLYLYLYVYLYGIASNFQWDWLREGCD